MKKSNLNEQGKQHKKGLQKFTEFEGVKTLEDFKKIKETAPEKLQEISLWLRDKLLAAINRDTPENTYEIDRYFNRLQRCMEAIGESEEVMEMNRRDRWNINEMKIKNYIHNTLATKRYLPTESEISTATGLSRVTVNKHIKENSLSSYKAEERDKYRMLNSTALNQLYYLAFQNGDVKALKMFIEITKEDSSGIVNNNYIQINNTKIDTVLIDKLPVVTRLQIESLILENLPK